MISALQAIDGWVKRVEYQYQTEDALATMKISGQSRSFMQIFSSASPYRKTASLPCGKPVTITIVKLIVLTGNTNKKSIQNATLLGAELLPRTFRNQITDRRAQETAEEPACEYVRWVVGTQVDAGEASNRAQELTMGQRV